MAYVQKNNPIPKGMCGRRIVSNMAPFKNKVLKSVSKELKKASNSHAGQAEKIDKVIIAKNKYFSENCIIFTYKRLGQSYVRVDKRTEKRIRIIGIRD